MTVIWYCLLTLGIATLFTMIGLGGGLVFSPLFIISGIPMALAVSTSLLINGLAALSASLAYMQKKMVNFKVALPLIVGSITGAPFGARLTAHLNLKIIMGILTVAMLFGAYRMAFSSEVVDEERSTKKYRFRRVAAGAGVGFFVGILGGMLGIGGGIFMVPLLIYVMQVSTRKAAATSTLISASLSISGFITHVSLGNYQLGFTVPVAIAGIIGGQIGSRLMSQKLSGKFIRRLFTIVLGLMSIKMIQKILSG